MGRHAAPSSGDNPTTRIQVAGQPTQEPRTVLQWLTTGKLAVIALALCILALVIGTIVAEIDQAQHTPKQPVKHSAPKPTHKPYRDPHNPFVTHKPTKDEVKPYADYLAYLRKHEHDKPVTAPPVTTITHSTSCKPAPKTGKVVCTTKVTRTVKTK